ncbi:PucR family transcriptional regulator [Gorillibacterium sp. sgz5001074]|uniref:PucR family transcriptional regulator n=1 Tax=Gorillibacterium sp. sgz5001074 TaxID=3446695 RepID=UPI003F67A9C6
MEWDHIAGQLGTILGAPVRRETVAAREWEAWTGQAPGQALSRTAVQGQVLYFRLGGAEAGKLPVLSVEEVLVTPSERRLVEMLLEASDPWAAVAPPKAVHTMGEEERKAALVKDWILQHLENGETRADMPELLASQLALYAPKIPFLLYGDYSDTQTVTYMELKKLLESFFDAEIILIPLMEKEWLILGSESLLSESSGDEREDEVEESVEEALASICGGLYEMLSNEWVGECHVTIHYPMTPAKSLLTTVHEMREAIKLGKMYHLGSNLHLPWNMHMEKLLYAVPDNERTAFVEQVLRGIDHVLDAEMLSTLEQFFALDCNVSETAKKLYIHRNTLLYRLDKFKQETGKDVRTFSDAVLVKTALLLYKVTKRK